MKITAIIPTFNCVNYLKLCLNTLRECAHTQPEILVIVDGSSDGTVEWLNSQGIRYIFRQDHQRPPPEVQGGDRKTLINRCYQNLDLGGVLATTDVLYFGNDDTVFSVGWDERLLEHVDTNRWDIITNQIVEPGVEVPVWHGIIQYDGAGYNITNFSMEHWTKFASEQSKKSQVESYGLNIGLMCTKRMFMEQLLPKGGWFWMDNPPQNMWESYTFKRVCSVPLLHFSGRASRCGGA